MKLDVLIFGGGPAGVLSALRLNSMGYQVGLVTRPRSDAAMEGLSERAIEVLRAHECAAALESLGPEVTRQSHWNGTSSEHNRETLIRRRDFDRALLRDAEARAILVRYSRSAHLTAHKDMFRIEGASRDGARFSLAAPALLEARGRRAPGGRSQARRGSGTTAIARAYVDVPKRPLTAIAASRDGWAWFASEGEGEGVLQLFVDHEQTPLPKRSALAGHFAMLAGALPEVAGWISDGRPLGPLSVRAAGPVLWSDLIGPRRIRIGDAAAAVDPLSGHGLFEALGSALAASVTLNTLLRRQEDRALAETFYRERTQQNFLRHCRTGRAFYALERRWGGAPFWSARATWPDREPAHSPPFAATPRIERRPVVEDDLIVARPVVVTSDHPRGIYQVAGVSLAALLARVGDLKPGDPRGELARHLAVTPAKIEAALDWLAYRRMILVRDGQLAIDPSLTPVEFS